MRFDTVGVTNLLAYKCKAELCKEICSLCFALVRKKLSMGTQVGHQICLPLHLYHLRTNLLAKLCTCNYLPLHVRFYTVGVTNLLAYKCSLCFAFVRKTQHHKALQVDLFGYKSSCVQSSLRRALRASSCVPYGQVGHAELCSCSRSFATLSLCFATLTQEDLYPVQLRTNLRFDALLASRVACPTCVPYGHERK